MYIRGEDYKREPVIIKRITGIIFKTPAEYIKKFNYKNDKLRFKDLQIVNSGSLDEQYVLSRTEIETMKPFIAHRICQQNKNIDMAKFESIIKQQDFISTAFDVEHKILYERGIASRSVDTCNIKISKEQIMSAITSDYNNLAERYLTTKYEKFKELIEEYTSDEYAERIKTEKRTNLKGVIDDSIAAASERRSSNCLYSILAILGGVSLFILPPTVILLPILVAFMVYILYTIPKSNLSLIGVILKLLMVGSILLVSRNLKDELPNELDAYINENNLGWANDKFNELITNDTYKSDIGHCAGEFIGNNFKELYELLTNYSFSTIDVIGEPTREPSEQTESSGWWWNSSKSWGETIGDGIMTVFIYIGGGISSGYKFIMTTVSDFIKELYVKFGKQILYSILSIVFGHQTYKKIQEDKIIKQLKKQFKNTEIIKLQKCRILFKDLQPPPDSTVNTIIRNAEQETRLLQEQRTHNREMARTLMERDTLDLTIAKFEKEKEQHKDIMKVEYEKIGAVRDQAAATREQTKAQVDAEQQREYNRILEERVHKLGLSISPELEKQAVRELNL